MSAWVLAFAAFLTGCYTPVGKEPPDSGCIADCSDAGLDASIVAPIDAAPDAPTDAAPDASVDTAPDACVADCTGRFCGSDGCGGSCGFCGAGQCNDESGQCTSSCVHRFGNGLSRGYGRLDGTVSYVVVPSDSQCPNDDNHVNVQIEMNGQVYEVAVNVESQRPGEATVYYHTLHAELYGPVWREGWHTSGVGLDYSEHLQVRSGDFSGATIAELSELLDGELAVGQRVSVYMDAYGPGGGHNVHRNNRQFDGAIVVNPASAPKYLTFRFGNQVFCHQCANTAQ